MHKQTYTIVAWIILTVGLLPTTAVAARCAWWQFWCEEPPPDSSVPDSRAQSPRGNKQPLPAPADLLMGDVHIQQYNDPYFNYQIVATIVNIGADPASGFSAGCTYKCPPGGTMISAGLDIVQGGYIAGNSSVTYKWPFRYMCAARPPTLNLMCTIQSAEVGTKTYSINDVALP
ncbi:hypothetical protein [Nitrosomonas communis]|uniref:Uncharacterized protein n=1 Tax=Nitrosomonas communis TaxID=44574 RepID=A0A1I4NFL1_9PROT|nr:hypothetical protein [Nitrosomonas communis]SFM14175.1 hypothetical protein SAMN05421863_101487 [Nitrosomonas communis]